MRSLHFMTSRLRELPLHFFILFTLLLHILRCPSMLFHPQFWAEGGSIFFAQDFQFGPAVLFQSYAGYLHLWPRIVAFLCGFAPLELIPLLYKLFSLSTHAVLLLAISSERFPATRSQKILLILATSLVPHGGEVFLNLTNTNSFCAILTIVLVMLKPDSKLGQRILEGCGIILSALSGPYILISYFPLLIYLFLFRKIGKKGLTAVCLTISFLTQALFLNRNPAPADTSIVHWVNVITMSINSVFIANIHISNYCAIALSLIFLICLFHLFIYQRSFKELKKLAPSFLFLVCAISILASGFFVCRSFITAIGPYSGGPRYYYVPYVLVLFGIILANGNTRFYKMQIVLLLLSFTTSFYYFPSQVWPDLRWGDQVRRFREERQYTFQIPPSWSFQLDHNRCWRCRLNLDN